MNSFQKVLDQPYPFYYEGRKLLMISLVIFFLAFLFNYIIQPFDINYEELKFSYFWVSIIHSVTPLPALILLSFVITRNKDSVENWILKKELFFIFLVLLLTGVFQFLVRDLIYFNSLNWSWEYLFEEVINTFLGGFLLAFIVVSANLNIQFLRNSEQARELTQKLRKQPPPKSASDLVIETEVKSETFELSVDDFVFARSDGNYVQIWTQKAEACTSDIKRMKLKQLNTYLENYPQIIRTHRSYLLNTHFIENVSGNAQGYRISLKNCKEVVPVSRNYLEEFNSHMDS